MSYFKNLKYKIVPLESYTIIRNCSICGCKSFYHNTNHFRINANGRLIDIWLIYQCEKCKHTYNLTIKERLRPEQISPHDYKRFMENDNNIALEYGTNKTIFQQNKAEIDENNLKYGIFPMETDQLSDADDIIFHPGSQITLENPYGLKLRPDRITAKLLRLSRSKVKQLEKNEALLIESDSQTQTIRIRVQA